MNLFEYIVRYVYIVYLEMSTSTVIPVRWYSLLERQSSKPDVVGSSTAVGNNFSFSVL